MCEINPAHKAFFRLEVYTSQKMTEAQWMALVMTSLLETEQQLNADGKIRAHIHSEEVPSLHEKTNLELLIIADTAMREMVRRGNRALSPAATAVAGMKIRAEELTEKVTNVVRTLKETDRFTP